jgi:hypothetical protein
MAVHPDVLIAKMTLRDFRKWVQFFARYGKDGDIAMFKEKLAGVKEDLAFLGIGYDTRAWKRVITMRYELDKALKKEGRL